MGGGSKEPAASSDPSRRRRICRRTGRERGFEDKNWNSGQNFATARAGSELPCMPVGRIYPDFVTRRIQPPAGRSARMVSKQGDDP